MAKRKDKVGGIISDVIEDITPVTSGEVRRRITIARDNWKALKESTKDPYVLTQYVSFDKWATNVEKDLDNMVVMGLGVMSTELDSWNQRYAECYERVKKAGDTSAPSPSANLGTYTPGYGTGSISTTAKWIALGLGAAALLMVILKLPSMKGRE